MPDNASPWEHPNPSRDPSSVTPGTAGSERSVHIRMYRHGFGDCFLLTFKDTGPRASHVVIDCGVLTGSPEGVTRIREAVENIAEVTSGTVDLLIATHEHADHLSGFNQARDVWEHRIKVKKTWLAWTEDLSSPAVASLKHWQKVRLNAVLGGVDQITLLSDKASKLGLDSSAAALERRADRCKDLLSFSVDEGEEFAALLALGADVTRLSGPARALRWIKERAGMDIDYCRPSQPPRSVPGQDQVSVYVLGPPEGNLIRREEPNRPGEGYLVRPSLTGVDCFALAVSDQASHGEQGSRSHQKIAAAAPFDPFYQLKFEDMKTATPPPGQKVAHSFFAAHYGSDSSHVEAYRRIDHDWLNLTESMALAHVSYVNNTSLVLAFELGEDGPVLLFPGDAQIGSWLSWRELSWNVGPDARRRKITGPDLLRRVVFYKVGHHGSHNATLRQGGLEEMTSPELVAFIPVHQATARKRNPPWAMPWDNLLTALTSGNVSSRVILSDQDVSKEGQPSPDAKADPSITKRWEAFARGLKWDSSPRNLWVEYIYHY